MTDGEMCSAGVPYSLLPVTFNEELRDKLLDRRISSPKQQERWCDIDLLLMLNGVSQREKSNRGGLMGRNSEVPRIKAVRCRNLV